MALTRIQIINEALSQARRSDLTSNGRLWLNLLLERLYKEQDWSFLLKQSLALSVSEGGAVPTDYWKFKAGSVFQGSDSGSEITTVTDDQYRALKRQGLTQGRPMNVWVDEQSRVFRFWPTPDTTYTMDLSYFYLPTLPTHTDSSGDSEVPVWPLAQDYLIHGIELKALFYQDDTRYEAEFGKLMKRINDGKLNSSDTRGGSHKLRLGKSFRRRW